MLDCACLAGIVALRHFRKPEVDVEGEEVTVASSFQSDVVSYPKQGNSSTRLSREHLSRLQSTIPQFASRLRSFLSLLGKVAAQSHPQYPISPLALSQRTKLMHSLIRAC